MVKCGSRVGYRRPKLPLDIRRGSVHVHATRMQRVEELQYLFQLCACQFVSMGLSALRKRRVVVMHSICHCHVPVAVMQWSAIVLHVVQLVIAFADVQSD